MRRVLCLVVLALAACRGEAPQDVASLEQTELEALVDSLMPAVAKATGLEFTATPRSVVRTRDEVRSFLLAKLEQELPPQRLEGIVTSYRLLGLIPDTLDIAKLFVDLYTEQVAGFYDPDSTTLYAVAGTDPTQLRLILAHELVHALQHQYLPLDSILKDTRSADRLAATQAVLEGQATLASFGALFPDRDFIGDEALWEQIREQLTTPRQGMEVFNRTPLALRASLIFPYLEGSEFVRWFRRTRASEQPFGPLMPTSTEQILYPDRFQRGDAPVPVAFAPGDTAGVLHEDTFGEFEIAVLRAVLAGIEQVVTDLPLGWAGDRLRVRTTPNGPALEWLTAWDEPRNAERFQSQIATKLVARAAQRPGYMASAVDTMISGKAGVRVLIRPKAE
ncbi:MAG TPA: hypothetical protein VFN90_06575 [Gemmatimonadales bacterium]|nr:hypothetical protein [Gemmatimonadales bacterium]